jgi:DNA-binding CsgD family transcriptional regulator
VDSSGLVGLVERDLERAHLQRAVDHSRHGVGRLAVVEGPAGIGKTSLLRSVRGQALQSGMNVRAARGAELEQDFAFGVVRQLFEPLLAAAAQSQRTDWLSGGAELAAALFEPRGSLLERGGEASIYPLLHGLYWLCSNLAATQPLALLVDDAQWVDEPSLEFLGFLARRLEELAILVVVTARPIEAGASSTLAVLFRDSSARLLRPRALSLEGVGKLLAQELGCEVDSSFALTCSEVTAGNPFLLHELARELEERGVAPNSANARAAAALAPPRIADSMLVRFGRISDAAPALAQAVAILGDGARLADAATLAGLDERTAIEAAVAMRNGGLLVDRPELEFAHPIIRAAIYQNLLPADRALRHAAAATLLRDRGAPPEQIAAQILLADGLDEAWVLEQLQLAASSALALGAPRSAVAYLRRALELQHGWIDRYKLVAQLGRAEVLGGLADGPKHLEEALGLAEDADQRARLAIMLAQVLKFTGRAARAVLMLEGVDGVLDPTLSDRVHVELLSTGLISHAAHDLLEERIRAVREPAMQVRTEREHFELVLVAFERMLDNRPAADVLGLFERAGPHPGYGGERIVLPPGPFTRGVILTYYDRLDEAGAIFTDLIDRARKRGAMVPLVLGLAIRGEVSYRAGDLGQALADAAEAYELSIEIAATSPILVLRPMGVINSVAVEQDHSPAELEALLRRTEENLEHDTQSRSLTLVSRARLLLALGRPDRALEQLLEFRTLPRTAGVGVPAYVPWRSEAALILHSLCDQPAAIRLAQEELELASAMGAPRAIGVALRASGLVQTPPATELLRRAVEVLERSPARLEYARALTDLGAGLRRAGERVAAREALRPAQELAARCGATRLARRANEEIAASGARAAPPGLSGVASLTPAERRVADLAAQGNTNREIAQALFVSEKTVETHLGHIYDKLGVRSRHRVRDVLERETISA